MKVTVIQCDSCGTQVPQGNEAKVTLTQDRVVYSGDYCHTCASTLRESLPTRKGKTGRKAREVEVVGNSNQN